MATPPSAVRWTDNPLLQRLRLLLDSPNVFLHCSYPFESILISRASESPFPQEPVVPATTNPPSRVSWIESPISSRDPPMVLSQILPPNWSILSNQTSYIPLPKDFVLPAMI